MNSSEFRKQAHTFVDWMADYLENTASYPVKSQVKPGEIISKLPAVPPEKGESMAEIFADFQDQILPGITHWQSPNFFAYFPANSSYPSLLAEMLTATLGTQCMIWETSPAAAELEEKVLEWLKNMMGLPNNFHGVIQDTASTATLTALLTAREKATAFRINDIGFNTNKFRIYCSSETHSSIEKGVKIAGFGKNNLVKIPVDENFALQPSALKEAIENDLNNGLIPICVVATLGTTGSTAIDPLCAIGEITKKHKVWLHVDAAFAGTAILLEEFRWMSEGLEMADSYVFNPHKWMFTNFDCSAYYVKDKEALIRTFSINPEYLKTKTSGQVNDYRDWGIQLGRRFRALKLWFVIRSFGVEGLKQKIRSHIELAKFFENQIINTKNFELLTHRNLNVVCFRFNPGNQSVDALNAINGELLEKLNKSGKLYLTHTKLNGAFTLRMVIGQTRVEKSHVANAWKMIQTEAKKLKF